MKYCTKCGSQITDNATFCTNCGEKIVAIVSSTSKLPVKVGIRKPSIKKSISARTTGKLNRKVKKAVIPFYGKKGMGLINNPKKALYNKVYHKTSFSIIEWIKKIFK